VLDYLGQNLGTLASAVTVIGGICAAVIFLVKNWQSVVKVWRGLWGWLNYHTNRARFERLYSYLEAQTHVRVLEMERRDAEIKALQEQIKALEEAQAQSLQTQMENYRKELVQADAAMQWVRKELFRLHQSSEHPNDLTTTEELRQQIKALEALVTALVEIDSKRLISAQDPTPEAKLIIQAAKVQRERKGFSELPPLPRTS
jgi:phage-related minor tail protein